MSLFAAPSSQELILIRRSQTFWNFRNPSAFLQGVSKKVFIQGVSKRHSVEILQGMARVPPDVTLVERENFLGSLFLHHLPAARSWNSRPNACLPFPLQHSTGPEIITCYGLCEIG